MLYYICQTIFIVHIEEYGLSYYLKTRLYFAVSPYEFSKNANFTYGGTVYPYYIRIVWRQLKFAFFVR